MRFGMIIVICPVSKNRSNHITWRCICDCGKEFTTSGDHLTRKTNPIHSCGCRLKRKGKEHPNWGGYGGITGNWWSTHVNRERKQNKRVPVEISITIEQAWEIFLAQKGRCALSGVELFFGKTSSTNSASLDRIDSSKGYIPQNVQWVHKHVNFMKRTYSMEYFIDFCHKIAQTHPRKGDKCEIL